MVKGALREASLAELRKVLPEALPGAKVRVERGHEGAVFLRVLSERFEESDDPTADLSAILAARGLRLPERTITTLRAPSELEEGEEDLFRTAAHFRGTPSWADALLFEPEEDPRDDREFRCRVIAFWGVKGGVGRTTALSHVTAILGRAHKVLALDLDLDSPGLVATLAKDLNGDRPRFEELVRLAGDTNVSHAELGQAIKKALRPAKSAPRATVLGPARADTEFVKDLLGPLSPSALYRGQKQALRKLVQAAILAAEAEIVLVDVRSGYCDESAMAVLDLADEVVMFVSPAPSTFGSLGPAIEAMERNRRALGRPGIVHVVAGMLPAGEDARQKVVEQLQGTIDDERRRVADVLETPAEALPPNIHVMSVFYTGRVVENEGQVLNDTLNMFEELAERIVPVPTESILAKVIQLDAVIAEVTAGALSSQPEDTGSNGEELPEKVPEFVQLHPEAAPTVIFCEHSPTYRYVIESLGADYEETAFSPDALKESGSFIWGMRLDDEEGRVPTSVWVRERLQDGDRNIHVTSLHDLTTNALNARAELASAGGPPVLSPASLRAALPKTSEGRLKALMQQASEGDRRALEALRGQDADQPRERLATHLAQATADPLAFERLQKLGVLRVTRRHSGPEMVRIVDLYALAPELGIRRVGRR